MANFALCIISGLLTGFSFDSPNLSFLVWFSLVPLLYSISKDKISLKRGIFQGIVFAFCYYGAAIFWVANVSRLGLILLLFYISIYYVGFIFLGRYFLNRPLRIIAIPCLWVAVEFLKENVWCGFGWANLGYSQYRNFYLIQTADLWGEKFISFLIVMVNVLIWEVFLFLKKSGKEKGARKIIFRKAVLVLFIFSICFLYSFYRLGGLGESDSIKVSVIQPSIPQELKWETSLSSSIINKLDILGKGAGENSLVIFPEAAWPHTLNKENFYELKAFIGGIKKDVVIGAILEGEGEIYNTALLFDEKGELLDSYRKIKLVPFGEYVPLRRFFSFVSIINSIGDITAGREVTGFSYDGKNFSVLICFEDIFPLHALRFSKGNDFLVNITNDAWFRGEPQASQHVGIMVFRAVENRISIVRSSNTGISGWVSFSGRIEKLKENGREVFFAGKKSFNVSLNKQRSFYNKYGEIFPFFCCILLLGIGMRQRAKSIRERA